MPVEEERKPAAVPDADGKKKRQSTSKVKSSAKVSSSVTGEKKKKRKSKLHKSIKGLITGESRKQKRARRAAERAAAGNTDVEPERDDEESVYGVDLDSAAAAASEAPAAASSSPSKNAASLLGSGSQDESDDRELAFLSPKTAAPPLQVILLLMDPTTRRFELLQLEFDSNKALVSDVLAQIPLSVTEEQLREQRYEGVCDRTGMEMIKTMRLSEFCKTNEVILAIPRDMTSKECARLARPILSDEGVISMLRASGINTEPVPVEPVPEERDVTLNSADDDDAESKPSRHHHLGWNRFTMIIVLAIAIAVQAVQMYITSPLKPGNVMSPGMWMSKCGLLSVLPLVCEKNSGLEMGHDGVLTLYGYDGYIQWRIAGGVCRPNDDDCVDGLVVQQDGNLVIGGKPVTSVTIRGDAPLSPWPFALEPKLRVVRR